MLRNWSPAVGSREKSSIETPLPSHLQRLDIRRRHVRRTQPKDPEIHGTSPSLNDLRPEREETEKRTTKTRENQGEGRRQTASKIRLSKRTRTVRTTREDPTATRSLRDLSSARVALSRSYLQTRLRPECFTDTTETFLLLLVERCSLSFLLSVLSHSVGRSGKRGTKSTSPARDCHSRSTTSILSDPPPPSPVLAEGQRTPSRTPHTQDVGDPSTRKGAEKDERETQSHPTLQGSSSSPRERERPDAREGRRRKGLTGRSARPDERPLIRSSPQHSGAGCLQDLVKLLAVHDSYRPLYTYTGPHSKKNTRQKEPPSLSGIHS